ncbi:g10486 [Coccomyxa viridis]|uniref:G10486 protein n=1 Tax=Coccomyxa viridis TaxID=1274662 RepID=A0ABP1G5V5_9CHLO
MGGCCGKLRGKAHDGKEKAKEKLGSGDNKKQSVQTPPAPKPSQYLKEDAQLQSSSQPKEAKKDVEMSVKEIVDHTIKNNRVVIWSKSYCPYCKKAKQAMFSVAPMDEVEVIELDHHPKGDEIQDYLKDITGGRSVPRVFIGGKFIGGGDDTVAKQKSGELEKLLKAQGIGKAVAA